MNETPVPIGAGVSRDRDRMWGLIGGALGVAVGLGSVAVAVFVEGADPLSSTSPYPAFFAKRQLLAYDYFLLFVIFLGAIIAVTGAVLARRSKFPRTDTLGALLGSGVLLVLGAALLFIRLVAVIRGS